MPTVGRHKPGKRATAVPATVTLSIWRAGAGLFLLSSASLAFEITLTHLFSLALTYHYAFLAVSSAVMGLGIGAALGYRAAFQPKNAVDALAILPALVALAIPLSVALFSLIGFTPGVILQAAAGALPFIAVGWFSARLYTLLNQKAAWLYAFDLAGGAAGLAAVQVLLNWMSAANAAGVLGLAAAAASLIYAGPPRKRMVLPYAAAGFAALMLVVSLVFHSFDLPSAPLAAIPPDKTMFRLLADPTSGSTLLSSAWSSFARVDLVSSSDPNQDYLFTNGGAGSYMLRFNGDLSTVQDLTQQLEYLPFDQFKPANTLILGAGAGKDVLQALLAGSQQITAVEINPAMVALTRQNAAFNGHIFDYPGVQTVVADGRSFVHRSNASYDMIYLNLVYAQAPTPGSNALSEAYIFTVQAFQDYWCHLAGDGRLAIISHQGLEGSRALFTALKALELEGTPLQEALKHTALLMYNGSDPNQNATVMVLQKSPLTPAQVQLFGQESQTLGMTPLFLPGSNETLLKDLVSGSMTLDAYLASQDYNLFPTTDERPFFFAIDRGLPQPLLILLAVALVGIAIYLLLMIGASRRPTNWQMVYFGGLGMGFMLLEVPLIQRTILLAGSPTMAMVVVLVALLLSGGAGSLVSGRWAVDRLLPRLAAASGLVTLLAVALAIWQPALIASLSANDATLRLLLGGLSLAPLGFLMGIPFANGIRLAGEHHQGALPYLWGWNALTGVAGSALAAAIAMLAGFNAVLLAGAACYLLVTVAALVQGQGR